MTGSWVASIYLTSYNVAQSLGWALVLARVIHRALQSRSLMGAYSAAGYLVLDSISGDSAFCSWSVAPSLILEDNS
jgi:uncharacterized membrane protein